MNATNDSGDEGDMITFTQQEPELTQPTVPARATETLNLSKLDNHLQETIITDLSRLLIFKAFSGEPIDRSKLAREAWGEKYKTERILGAALDKAKERLKNVWGFDVKGVPKCMANAKSLPAKYKDRLYIVNDVDLADETGKHSKALHRVHTHSAAEKGLLMLTLSFIRCRGDVSDGMRWLDDATLYKLLHVVDENIPSEPPSTSSRQGRNDHGTLEFADDGSTPNVDMALEKFVHLDYLLKRKEDKEGSATATQSDQTHVLYAMGPRAGVEIGRKQIVYFCAEVLGEEPDPIMLKEIEDEDGNVEEAMDADE